MFPSNGEISELKPAAAEKKTNGNERIVTFFPVALTLRHSLCAPSEAALPIVIHITYIAFDVISNGINNKILRKSHWIVFIKHL